jgi:hypothetical protein
MAMTLDHLGVGACVRVVRGFTDRRGQTVLAGTEGVVTHLAVDWPAQDIVMEWRRTGQSAEDELRFAMPTHTPGASAARSATPDAPGIGRMKAFFERIDGDRTNPTVREEIARQHAELAEERRAARLARIARPLPDDPLGRALAYADRHDFAAASEAFRRVPDDGTEELARSIQAAAERAAKELDLPQFLWLRARAEDCWYAWSAQATSGGEGAVKLLTLRPALERLADCERAIRAAME